METKSHYRKVFKSDHLGSADLEEFTEEGKTLIFTIKNVTQHEIKAGDKNSGVSVAGRRISANIAHFIEPIKPLVLNATNSRTVKKLAGGSPFVEDWNNIMVDLYIDPQVKMKGEIVGGIRIKDEPPKVLSKDDITLVIDQINKCKNVADLTTLYNSDVKYRTNKEVVAALGVKKQELLKV